MYKDRWVSSNVTHAHAHTLSLTLFLASFSLLLRRPSLHLGHCALHIVKRFVPLNVKAGEAVDLRVHGGGKNGQLRRPKCILNLVQLTNS